VLAMASNTEPRTPGLLRDCGFHGDIGNASMQTPTPTRENEPNHRRKYAKFTITIALGVAVGILGYLAFADCAVTKQTGHGHSTAMAKAFVAPQANPVAMRATQPQMALGKRPKPLSPGSNYPSTKNIQTQKNGFGTWLQKFQTVDKKSKYGMPIYLPSGNINPAYLEAERKEMGKKKKANVKAAEGKRKKLIAKKEFELADFIRKKVGDVSSMKSYKQNKKEKKENLRNGMPWFR